MACAHYWVTRTSLSGILALSRDVNNLPANLEAHADKLLVRHTKPTHFRVYPLHLQQTPILLFQ